MVLSSRVAATPASDGGNAKRMPCRLWAWAPPTSCAASSTSWVAAHQILSLPHLYHGHWKIRKIWLPTRWETTKLSFDSSLVVQFPFEVCRRPLSWGFAPWGVRFLGVQWCDGQRPYFLVRSFSDYKKDRDRVVTKTCISSLKKVKKLYFFSWWWGRPGRLTRIKLWFFFSFKSIVARSSKTLCEIIKPV
jgi:hypothetical protein